MYILGDIGNTETKLFLISSKNKLLRNITFQSRNINEKTLNTKLKVLQKDYKKMLRKEQDILKRIN